MIAGPHPEDPLAGDDEWGAAPTHPEPTHPELADVVPADRDDGTVADPFVAEAPSSAPAATGEEWDPAPPLPLGVPKAPPKPKGPGRARRAEQRGRRGEGTSNEAPPREPKADRPPPTAEERLQIALKHAYRHLTKRDRTEAEVRAHLTKRDTDPATLELAIAELLELRYLDDARYVQRYVEDRRRLDGWGPVRITQGLRKAGVDPALIPPAIAAVAEQSGEDDVSLATELVQRRFHRRPLDGDRDRQKALRAVVAKGHSLDVAYAAVRPYEQRGAEGADG